MGAYLMPLARVFSDFGTDCLKRRVFFAQAKKKRMVPESTLHIFRAPTRRDQMKMRLLGAQ